MPRVDETTFVIHGLDMDNRAVRASVFAQKLRTLISALQLADKLANGKPAYDYLISGLINGSAGATIRERRRSHGAPQRSAIAVLESTASAIYNGERVNEKITPALVKKVEKLGSGVSKKFSHAELAFSDNNVIRIDDFLLRQTAVAYKVAMLPDIPHSARYFQGIAVGSFDGVLKEIDARGTVLRGKLVLISGGAEIDCVMNKEQVPEARDSFDKRVVIDGTAHYDGLTQMPVRVDVRTIRQIKEGADLMRWRGALRSASHPDIDDEDW